MTMTNSDNMRYKSKSRSVSNHSPSARQDQVRSSMKSGMSGPRPLGTPANDLSMYYDRRMAALHNKRSTGHRKARMGQCASADLERRRNSHQNKGSWVHNGLVTNRSIHHNSFTALVSPQLPRRQTRSDVPPTRELGLTRSNTVAELRTPPINLTGVSRERPHPQLSRSSTWCAMPKVSSRSMSRFSSRSTSSLPLISSSTDGRADALISASCDGLTERVSALRSLANNPKLKVSIVNGSAKVSPRLNSLPSGLESTTSQKRHTRESNREVVVELSKYGYHCRSNSPTYRRLIYAKEQLDVALCKKLREVRRQLDGQTARENSAMTEGLRLKMDDRGSEEWYKDMVKKEIENDEASEIILSMTMANTEPLGQLEALDLTNPRPHVDLNFDIRYIQSRINDSDVLNINVEEEEKKIQERRDREKLRKPVRARSRSPSHFRRSCEACCVEGAQTDQPRVDFLRTNKSRKVKLRRRHGHGGRQRFKESDDSDSDIERAMMEVSPPLMMDEPFVPQQDLTLPAPSPPPPTIIKPLKSKKKTRSERTKSPLSTKSSKSTKSKTSSKALSVDEQRRTDEKAESVEYSVLEEPEPEIDSQLPSLSNSSPYTDNRSASVTSDRGSIEAKPAGTPPPPDDDKPKLSDKEKFLMMRKRMEERQKERMEKKESFVDYSMIAFHGTRKERAGRGQKGLGNTLSNRLESMASFKSNRKEDGSRKGLMSMLSSDDDDDDDDDDDEDDGEDADDE